MDRHSRPYKCAVVGCAHQNGFGSQGDLKRHENSVHKQSNLFCPVPGCSRSSLSSNDKPFSREDNLQDHIKRQHKDLPPKHVAGPQGGGNSLAGNQDVVNPNLSRQASPAGEVDERVRGTRKRRRLWARTMSSENPDSAKEDPHELEEENNKLRKRIWDLEHELKLSKERAEKLECDLEFSKKMAETLVDVIGKLH